MKKIVVMSIVFITSLMLMISCTKDLDQFPTIETTSENVYTSLDGYKSVLAKLYGSFAVAGNNRGDGDPDMASSTASWGYLRVYFNMQQVATDELIYSWAGGDNMVDLQFMK